MRVLITGGTGTISSGLVQECVNSGYEVVALTRGNSNQRNIEKAEYLHCDVRRLEEVKAVLNNRSFDVVIECLVYELSQLKISLQCFSDICKQYVFISTAAVYNTQAGRIKEADEKSFTEWSYSKNKIECENYLQEYCRNKGLAFTIIRPTVTYGDYRIPYPVATRNPGWTLFQRMLDGNPILGSVNVKHSAIHIEDFSKMVIKLLGNKEAYNEDYHICSDNNDILWDDVIKVAGMKLGVSPQIVHVPVEVYKHIYPQLHDELKFHKNRSIMLDENKIRAITGYESRIGLEEGITRIISSMKSEFDAFHLRIDTVWNDYCNATILYAYKHGKVSEAEKAYLDDFFLEHSYKEYEQSLKRVKKYNFRRKMSAGKNKIKKYLSHLLSNH